MNTKKFSLLLLAGLLVSTVSAKADIIVTWSGAQGFLRSDDFTGLTQPANGSQTAYAQLIFTPFNSYGEATAGGGVEGFELVLDTYVITDSVGTDNYGVLAAQLHQGAYFPGYIYARVFDQGTGSDPLNNIVIGTYYYNGPIIASVDNSDPANPNFYNVNGANTSVTWGFGDTLNVQVVPEPATLALLGLGGGLLFLSRRRKA